MVCPKDISVPAKLFNDLPINFDNYSRLRCKEVLLTSFFKLLICTSFLNFSLLYFFILWHTIFPYLIIPEFIYNGTFYLNNNELFQDHVDICKTGSRSLGVELEVSEAFTEVVCTSSWDAAFFETWGTVCL